MFNVQGKAIEREKKADDKNVDALTISLLSMKLRRKSNHQLNYGVEM